MNRSRTSFRSSRMCLAVAFSILCHGAVLFLDHGFKLDRSSDPLPAKTRIQMVHISEARASLKVTKANSAKTYSPPNDNDAPSKSSEERDPASKTGYTRLLPLAVHGLDKVFQEEKPEGLIEEPSWNSKVQVARLHGLKGDRLTPEGDRSVDELASRIIIPTYWRTDHQEGRAIAYVTLEGQELWLKSLSGDPMMRAVLYQNLKTKKIRDYLMAHLQRQNLRQFKVVLRFVRQSDSYQTLNTEVSGFTDGMVITKSLPPIMKSFGGIPLSDSHAKRAKMREQKEVEKLMSISAFSRVLDREKLSESI